MSLLDKANSMIGDVNEAIGTAKSVIGGVFSGGQTPNDASVSLTYPLDLRDAIAQYPIVRFLAEDETRNEKEILLPMPQGGISFGDSGQYGQVDLGLIAGSIAELANSGGTDSLWSRVVNTWEQSRGRDILANIVTDNQAIRFATGTQATLRPPNTNTTFTNNSLRQFGFQFKLTASSQKGSEAIRDIVKTFRRLTYASNQSDEETLILNYPPVWTISFLDGFSGSIRENQYLPRIGKCYLTSLNTVYNSSSNLVHHDGAPTEVDVSLTFQETRVLTRRDIDELEDKEGERI